MKNLKNLTIASTLCVSACITAPTLTNAMMKSGKTPALSTNFMNRQDYISLTGTGKKTPGPFVQSRIRIFGDNGTSNSNTSGANLPSTSPKKQVIFGNSSSSSSSETSNISDKSPLNSNFKNRQDYISFTDTGKKTPGPFVQSKIRMLGDKNNSDRTTPKPIPTQTPNTSDASTQTNPQASKGNVGKLKKFFGN